MPPPQLCPTTLKEIKSPNQVYPEPDGALLNQTAEEDGGDEDKDKRYIYKIRYFSR